MIEALASGANTSLVAKNGTKKNFSMVNFSALEIFTTPLLQAIESKIMDRFLCSRCPNVSIDQPDMTGYLKVGPLPPSWQKRNKNINPYISGLKS